MSRYVPPYGFGSDDTTELRDRLIGMRAELVEQMTRDGIAGGFLALLAGVNAAIIACEAAAAPADVVEGARAILADDSTAITLTLYGETGVVAAVMLAPGRAVALAAELIAAALPKLRAP